MKVNWEYFAAIFEFILVASMFRAEEDDSARIKKEGFILCQSE